MNLATNEFAFAEHSIRRAKQAFVAHMYEDAARDAYFSALDAAKQLVSSHTGKRPTSHSGARKHLSALVQCGLSVGSGSLDLLSSGYRRLLKDDHSAQPLIVTPEEAEDYLNRTASFIAAAKALCT